MILDVELISRSEELNIELNGTIEFNLGFDIGTLISQRVEKYDGPYFAIPKTFEQEFETKDKKMIEDFVVNSIPYSSVDNVQGGVTINIAYD